MKRVFIHSRPVVKLFAWLSLAAAFVLGQIAAQSAFDSQLTGYLPQQRLTLTESRNGVGFYRFALPSGSGADAVLLADGTGYGGPLSVAIQAYRTADGARIKEVALLQNRETPPYVDRLVKMHFFKQFENRSVTDSFLLSDDIDGYSGATVTARGVSDAIAHAVHLGAVEHLGLTPSWHQPSWSLGLEELFTLLLVAGALYISSRRAGSGPMTGYLKAILPLASLLFVGFYLNASISIGSLYGILLGYLPTFQQHPIWWMLMLGIVAGVVLMSRNIYCHRLCPFGAIQGQLTRISGLNLRVPPRLAKAARPMLLTLIWASLMLVFLSRHPALGSYEPFSMMFSLEGVGVQWYVLPLSLIGAFFIGDFWCRFFCPVGLSINEAVRLRRKVEKKLIGYRK